MSEDGAPPQGRYYDGHSAAAQRVRLRIEGKELLIETPAGARLCAWPLKRLVHYPDDTGGGLRLGLNSGGDARLVITDPALITALRESAPHLFRRNGLRMTLRLALGLMVLSATVVAGLYCGLPRAAEGLVPFIPPRLEADLGARYLASLEQMFPACPLDDRAQRALESLSTRLLSDIDVPFDVSVDVIDMKIENAFALPGGHVIVTHQLLKRMESPDELAGVLAHEFGHVIERHAMISVIQQTGLNAAAAILTGGSAGSSGWILSSAGTLASLSYTRRLEARADARGLGMLKHAGISAAGFADLFDRLEKSEHAEGGLPPFLNSHPPSPERAAAARAAALADAPPALDAPDWKAVKSLCEPAPPKDEAPKKAGKAAKPKAN